jgi:hypothetical protein
LIEWTVGLGDQPSFGHVYGWQLDAVSKLRVHASITRAM